MTTLTIDPAQQEQQQQQQTNPATQQQQTQAPAPGTPEYDAAMAAKGAALRQQFEEQRPEYLPEKFWKDGKADYESLAKSYQELEKKLGGSPTTDPAKAPAADPATQQQQTPQAQPLDFSKYSQEFMSSGALSEASYAELVAKGIPKEMVDTYVAGQQAIVQKTTSELLDTVGGAENFNAMKAWAASNLSDAELTMFNTQVKAGTDSAKMALQWLNSKYTGTTGAQRLLSGSSGSSSNGNGFRSMAEVTAAMKDARYQTDPAYRADVAQRFAAKSF